MEAELASRTLCFLKRFRCKKKEILAVSCASSSKSNVPEFFVNAGAWESCRRVKEQPVGLCLEASHIHTTFNRDSVRTDKAN